MTKIVYLDIDGVLNCPTDDEERLIQYEPERPGNAVCATKLNRLKMIHEATDCEFVIVSSWATIRSAKSICEFLEIPYHSNAWCTSGGYERGKNVELHASHYGLNGQYAILDDGWQRMYHNRTRVVCVNGRVGLTDQNVREAIALLS